MKRNRAIIRASIVGTLGNLFLSAFKFLVGTAANSVSIRADAVNNLTDAMSSVITIIGTFLSEKKPDKKHPFGYGRIEYLTALFIGMSIFYAGVAETIQAVRRIIHPENNIYTKLGIMIVIVAVLVKIVLGIYTMRKGKKYSSMALKASAKDAFDDSIGSTAALAAVFIYIETGVNVEAYVGLAISIMIIRTSVEILRETISSILGERVDVELSSAVKKSILSFPEVDGVFDIIVHNYGKEKLIGSAHIAIKDVLRAAWVDNLQRAITKKVREDTGVEMLGITIYAENSRDKEAIEMRETIEKIASENEAVKGIYGFYLDKVDKVINFELKVAYGSEDIEQIRGDVVGRVQARYPEYKVEPIVGYE